MQGRILLRLAVLSALLCVLVVPVYAQRPFISSEQGNDSDVRSPLLFNWVTEAVDTGGNVGYENSLVLDAAGWPHISYLDQTNGDLKYAYYDGATWHLETIDSTGFVGIYSWLALDSAGYPHITYSDYTNPALKYAYYDGAAWHIEVVDANQIGPFGAFAHLVLDDADQPHVSYCSWISGGCDSLRYAYRDGAGWHIQTVDSVWVGRHPSLALDSAGYPHITYYVEPTSDLKYAWYDGSSWHLQVVDSAGAVGLYNSMVLDSADHPHISYYEVATDRAMSSVKYAFFDGQSWHFETVAIVGNYNGDGRMPLALDAAGQPHIAFFDAINGDLRYAYNDGSSWQIETVDGTGEVGRYCSLALDPAGGAHISYYDFTQGDLRYAFTCTPVSGAGVSGPQMLAVGEAGTYTASFTPSDASAPVTFAWSNGSVGPSASYQWSQPGSYTIAVTATNPCGQAQGELAVTVCLPVEAVQVGGPSSLTMGDVGAYTATYTPINATLPVTLSWDNGAAGPTAAYSWTIPGAYSVTARAENACGWAEGALAVEVLPIRAPISPTGGVLFSPPDRTRYVFPAGAFSETVIVTHTPLAASAVPTPPGPLTGIGHFFQATAVYSETGEPAEVVTGTVFTITIQYTDRERGSAIEDTLDLYYWDGTAWVVEPSSVLDTANNLITATPGELGEWGVMGETNRIFLPIVVKGY